MANIKLLQEAIQAFANGDNEVADKKMRNYFVEAAKEINKKLEEEMDTEEEMCEDIDTDPEQSMTDEVGYKLDEEEDLDESLFGNLHEEDDEYQNDDIDVETDDTDDTDDSIDISTDVSSEETPDVDQWADIKSALQDLERMFDEVSSGGDDSDFDIDVNDEETDDFTDIDFGDEHVDEAYQMKKVAQPDKTEKSGVNTKSVVAPNAKSPVDGVKPVTIKDGTVDATDDKFENSDALDVKVDDNNNVMDNGKHVMKPAKTPKNTAANSKSVLPKNKPSF